MEGLLVNVAAFGIMGLVAVIELYRNRHRLKPMIRAAMWLALSASVMYLLATFGVEPKLTGIIGHVCNALCVLCFIDASITK